MSAAAPRRKLHSEKKPWPPFGAKISALIKRGEKPNVFIIAGSNAWRLHEIRSERIVLPPGEDPSDFDWTLLKGLSPTVIGDDAPRSTLRKLAWCLLRAGCPLVCVIYRDLIAENILRVNFFRNE